MYASLFNLIEWTKNGLRIWSSDRGTFSIVLKPFESFSLFFLWFGFSLFGWLIFLSITDDWRLFCGLKSSRINKLGILIILCLFFSYCKLSQEPLPFLKQLCIIWISLGNLLLQQFNFSLYFIHVIFDYLSISCEAIEISIFTFQLLIWFFKFLLPHLKISLKICCISYLPMVVISISSSSHTVPSTPALHLYKFAAIFHKCHSQNLTLNIVV